MLYEMQTLSLRPATVPAALPRIGEILAARKSGNLAGFWFSEIGALNQVVAITAYGDHAALMEARAQAAETALWAPLGDVLVAQQADAFAPFPVMQPMKPGKYGPFYELRDYIVKPDGLAATMEGWAKALEPRLKLSPLAAVMYAITGPSPRMVHIWPYASLNDRQSLRGEAVQKGIWPPPGGPARLVKMQNSILLPAPFSPMQ